MYNIHQEINRSIYLSIANFITSRHGTNIVPIGTCTVKSERGTFYEAVRAIHEDE